MMTYGQELAEIVRASGMNNAETIAGHVESPDRSNSDFDLARVAATPGKDCPEKAAETISKILRYVDEYRVNGATVLTGMLDEARWAAVQIWAHQSRGGHNDSREAAVVSFFDHPAPEYEARWGTILEDLTETEGCPHTEWLLDRVALIEKINKNRFERIGTIWVQQRTLVGYGPIDHTRDDGVDIRNNVVFARGDYAWDTRYKQVVHQPVWREGWTPTVFSKDHAEAAVSKERTGAIATTLLAALAAISITGTGVRLGGLPPSLSVIVMLVVATITGMVMWRRITHPKD